MRKITPKTLEKHTLKLTTVLKGIAEFEKEPFKQLQYIVKELPEFIESVWEDGHGTGFAEGVSEGKKQRFNCN